MKSLLTDVWVRPKPWTSIGANSIADRFHDGLSDRAVTASNMAAIRFEFSARVKGHSGWQLIAARNDRFQEFVLSRLKQDFRNDSRQPVTLFAYSYAAHRILRVARDRGWKAVLGQIDPGPFEEKLVAQLHHNSAHAVAWRPAPDSYWEQWQTECELADCIVVNSEWSRDALVSQGVRPEKIKIIPLAFEGPPQSAKFKRSYPPQFNLRRPMRVLFLGQVCLRKGMDAVFEAIELLNDKPVEFWFIGPVQLKVPDKVKRDSHIRWFGSVSRSSVAAYYQAADVFLFPTLSDGFGLTQLEAQSWKLPVIASKHCGSVVKDGINGMVLSDVSGSTIAKMLSELVSFPEQLQQMSNQSGIREEFSLASLASALLNL